MILQKKQYNKNQLNDQLNDLQKKQYNKNQSNDPTDDTML